MIVKIYPNEQIYGKYFLATEAPGDENDTETPEPEIHEVTVNADRRRRKDFTDIDDGNDTIDVDSGTLDDDDDDPEDFTDIDTDEVPDPEPAADDTPTDPPAEEPAQDEPVAETNDNPPPETPPVDDAGGETDVAVTDDAAADTTDDATAPTDDTDDAGDPAGADSNPADVTVDDTPDATTDDVDNTDFTAVDDGTQDPGSDPNAGGDPNADPNATGDQPPVENMNPDPNANKAGVDFDSTRKYNLYKEFMSLYNACENYISKLENLICNDSQQNQLLRLCTSNLRDIKDLLYDYATIRFPINSYVQSLLFYQKMVVSTQLIFAMLKDIDKVRKS